MAREIWPYRRAPATTLEFTDWRFLGEGETEPLPRYLEGWDPLTDVSIQRTVRCDVSGLRTATGLPEPVPLFVTVSWVNSQSYMAERIYREPLSTEQTIRITLPSERLGGTVQLVTTITVSSTDVTRPLGTARWAGSVLASDERTLVLEGDGPMFPITSLDFASTRFAAEASWVLQLPDDLMLPVLGSVLLMVNTKDRELSSALGSANPSPREAVLLDELETAIAAHLIEQAVSRRHDLESEDWPDQSAGLLLSRYLAIADAEEVPAAFAANDAAIINAAVVGAARAAGFGRRLN